MFMLTHPGNSMVITFFSPPVLIPEFTSKEMELPRFQFFLAWVQRVSIFGRQIVDYSYFYKDVVNLLYVFHTRSLLARFILSLHFLPDYIAIFLWYFYGNSILLEVQQKYIKVKRYK